MKLTDAAIFTTCFVGLSAGTPIERHALPSIKSTAGVGPVIPSIDVARPVLNHVPIVGRQEAHEAFNSLGPVIPAAEANLGAHIPNNAFSASNSPGPAMPADMPEPVLEKRGHCHRLVHEREELAKVSSGGMKGKPGAINDVPWEQAAQPGRDKRSYPLSGVPDVVHGFVSTEGAAPVHETNEALSSGPIKPKIGQPWGKDIVLDEEMREEAAKNRMIDWAGGW